MRALMRNMAVLSRFRQWVKRLLECVSLPVLGLSSTCEQTRALWANSWNTTASIMWLHELHGLRELSLISMSCVWLEVVFQSKTRFRHRCIKNRSNDCNIPTQHIAPLLGATSCARLATLLRHTAAYWVLLAQVWKWLNLVTRINRVATLEYVALKYCDRLTVNVMNRKQYWRHEQKYFLLPGFVVFFFTFYSGSGHRLKE